MVWRPALDLLYSHRKRAARKGFGMQLANIVLLPLFSVTAASSSYGQAMSQAEFDRLPKEVRATIQNIRTSCKELDPDFTPYAIDQGITIIDLDGSKAIMVDAEDVCNGWVAGANCSNRGCDLKIWKQTGTNVWRKVFDEHLYRKFISLSDDNRFRMMAVSIYAGDPRYKPNPKKDYTSGMSCDALVRYRNNNWTWEKIG